MRALLLVGAALPVHAALAAAERPELVLYVYDSFVAEGGLGRKWIPLFERKCGCKVRTLASGDSLQMLSRLEIDQQRGETGKRGDVIVGLDLQSWGRARQFVREAGPAAVAAKANLAAEARVPQTDEGFVPYDFGPMTFIADMEQLKKLKLQPPRSLRDLLKPEWKRNFILEDPRTSGPGLAFALFSRVVFGEDFAARVSELRGQWLTLASGWDQAYGLFLRKEAPLVWSYVTSQAYHAEHGDAAGRYRAVALNEGAPVQVEGAALVRGVEKDPARLRLAREFLEFVISPEAQSLVATANWMLPSRNGVKLPESFRKLPKLKKFVRLPIDSDQVAGQVKEWSRALGQGAVR